MPSELHPLSAPVDLLITQGWVLTMDDVDAIYYPGSVAIHGGRIIAVGPSREIDAACQPKDTLDASLHVVMPGLVNIHGHASNSLIRGLGQDLGLADWLRRVCWPCMDQATEEDLFHAVRLSAVEMLLNGITTFADMWPGVGSSAQAVAETGQRALLAHNIKDFGDAARGQRELAAALDAHARWDGYADGRVCVGLGPHSVYTCQPELLAECASAARAGHLHLQIHGSETTQELEDCQARHGRSPVELMADVGLLSEHTVLAHAVHVSATDLQHLRATGTCVAHNVASNLKLASGFTPVQRYLDAGLCVGLGTDGPGSNDGLDLLRDLKTAALLQKGLTGDATVLPARAALRMVTRWGARALNLEGEIGTLELGKQADLILLNFDQPHFTPRHFDYAASILSNLIYCASGADVDTVIVGGQVLVHHRKPLHLDIDSIRHAAQASGERVVRAAGLL